MLTTWMISASMMGAVRRMKAINRGASVFFFMEFKKFL